MIFQSVSLPPSDAVLDLYLPDDTGLIRTMMLVLPGGGYECICNTREGEPIALAFLAKGMAAAVLHYSVGDRAVFPRPLNEASLAVAHLRKNAGDFRIDPNRIFACGFSAGGHLCASLGTLWHRKESYEPVGLSYGENKIAGMLPIYPVISAMVEQTSMGTFFHLLGTETPSEEEKRRYSLEYAVGEHTVPAFLVHTASDQAVSVRNSLVFAQALTEHHIPYELHIFPKGAHGIALANEITDYGEAKMNDPIAARWVDLAAAWINRSELFS